MLPFFSALAPSGGGQASQRQLPPASTHPPGGSTHSPGSKYSPDRPTYSLPVATANNSADNSSQQLPNGETRISLRNSVQERGFSCTEYAFGVKNRLLVYATRFQRHSVLKTGFWCTEGKFGAKKGLLVYGMDIRCGAGVLQNNHWSTRGQWIPRLNCFPFTEAAERPPSRKTTAGAQEARPQYIAADYNRVNA